MTRSKRDFSLDRNIQQPGSFSIFVQTGLLRFILVLVSAALSMGEQTTINLHLYLTMNDLVPAVMMLSLRRYRWGIAVLAVLVLVVVVQFWTNGHTLAQNLDLLATMILLPPVFAIVASYLTARSYLRNTPSAQGEHRYSFSEDRIDFTGQHSQGTLRWTALTRSWETRRSFLLYVDHSRGVVLPKRFFTSESDVEALRQLLRRRLPKSQLRD